MSKFQAITSLPGYRGTHYINLNSREIPYAVEFHNQFGFLNDDVIDSIHLSRRNGFLSKPYRTGQYGYRPRPGILGRGAQPDPEQVAWLVDYRQHVLQQQYNGAMLCEWWNQMRVRGSMTLWYERPERITFGKRNMTGGYSGSLTINEVSGVIDPPQQQAATGDVVDYVSVDGTIANRPEPTPAPPPPPPPPAEPRSWQQPTDRRSDMNLQQVIQEMRRRADQSDDGVIISTRTVKGIIQWLDRGMPLTAALDRITQSWEPETISHICGHIVGSDWIVNQRRNKLPLTDMGDWQRVIDEAEDRGMTPASWWPHVIDILTLPTQRAWLFGPTGCGKTYGFSQLCEVMGWDTVHVGCGNDMILSDLIGGINPKTATGWQDGPVLDAYENGKTLILDEFAKLSADCTGGLNSYLNGEPMVSVPRPGNSIAHKHPDFRVVICDNSAGNGTDGQYMVEQQSVDTVARFEHLGLQVFCNYDNNIEAAIIGDWND